MNEETYKNLALAIQIGKQSQPEDNRSHPKVGAVAIIDGEVVGSSYRGELSDGDHAEYTLLEKKLASVSMEGATLITTLEPCVSRNRHKPCSEWIIEKGIKTVFIGMLDPNPRIYNKGVVKLKENGVDVHYFPPDLREEIESDNQEFISQFRANPKLEGRAVFNYTDNDGKYTVGNGECVFETHWSKASDTSIHVYRDGTNIQGLAVALDAKEFADIRDASIFNMSSRVRTLKEGEIVVMQNRQGYFAAIRIVDVRDRDRTDDRDELIFDYCIINDKSTDLSAYLMGTSGDQQNNAINTTQRVTQKTLG